MKYQYLGVVKNPGGKVLKRITCYGYDKFEEKIEVLKEAEDIDKDEARMLLDDLDSEQIKRVKKFIEKKYKL